MPDRPDRHLDKEQEMTLKDKKVLVAGAGKSGIGSASLLIRSGASVSLYDGNEHLKARDIYDKLEGKKRDSADSWRTHTGSRGGV